jgi:hypothetical protein
LFLIVVGLPSSSWIQPNGDPRVFIVPCFIYVMPESEPPTDPVFSWPWLPRFLPVGAIVACILAAFLSTTSIAADRLSVVVLSGLPSSAKNQELLGALQSNLEDMYPVECKLIRLTDLETDRPLESLKAASVALLLVTAATFPVEVLAEVRTFIMSGKGLVVIGQNRANMEEWLEFERSILGTTSISAADRPEKPHEVRMRDTHPIIRGAESFMPAFVWRIEPGLKPDAHVLIEASVGAGFNPIAWTRQIDEARVFYLATGDSVDFDQVSFFRLIGNSLLWATRRAVPGSTTRLHRTWMPDANPSSFAVGFPDGLNYCFDPTRCTLAYAWTGDFIDLAPTVAGKLPRNAHIRGTVAFRAGPSNPFRPEGGSLGSVKFRGYRLEESRPKFLYEADDLSISESIYPSSAPRGLIQEFEVRSTVQEFRYRAVPPSRVVDADAVAIRTGEELRIPPITHVKFHVFIPAPSPAPR